jgi:hypothetical protein
MKNASTHTHQQPINSHIVHNSNREEVLTPEFSPKKEKASPKLRNNMDLVATSATEVKSNDNNTKVRESFERVAAPSPNFKKCSEMKDPLLRSVR